MGLKEDEDFKNFDPKAFWAAKNNDTASSLPNGPKKKQAFNFVSHEDKVRKFLKTAEGKLWTMLYQPLTMPEIAGKMETCVFEAERILRSLKKSFRCQIGRGHRGTTRTYFTINRELKDLWL